MRIFFRFLLVFCLLPLHSIGAKPLSEAAVLSLLTAEPGQALYSRFGHSAIRVQDTAQSLDLVFNYGIFDFNTPNFYSKFVRGRLPYRLGVQTYSDFLLDYQIEKRKVTEQIIQVDGVTRQAIFDFLLENYKPENRYYAYDFFFDNCASRIRDVLEANLNEQIQYPDDYQSPYTYRQMLDLYMESLPWINFGMDLGLGLPADREADLRGQMFLPDFLASNLAEARWTNEGEEVALLGPARTILPSGLPVERAPWLTPTFFFWGLLALTLLFSWLLPGKWQRRLDALLFTSIGVAGLFLLFLWFGTDHQTTKANLHLQWANPLFLFFAWMRRRKKGFKLYLLVLGSLVAGTLITSPWSPQELHPALVPLLLALLVRLGLNFLEQRQKQEKV